MRPARRWYAGRQAGSDATAKGQCKADAKDKLAKTTGRTMKPGDAEAALDRAAASGAADEMEACMEAARGRWARAMARAASGGRGNSLSAL